MEVVEDKKRNAALSAKLAAETARNADLKKGQLVAAEALGKSLVRHVGPCRAGGLGGAPCRHGRSLP
jgi:hypothetical protein